MNSAACNTQREMKYFTPGEYALLDPLRVPEHVAIILDGNRRWAKKEGQYVVEGHRQGADNVIEILKAAKELGIRYITLYVFSTENWNRPRLEVTALLWLFETYIRKQIPEMVQHCMRFQTIGDLSKFPESLQKTIQDAKDATKDCEAIEVAFAMNYGSRDEMVRATKKMIADFKADKLKIDDLTEEKISAYLDTAAFPDPELLIRTSGEKRISNFLMWQLSYAELYLTETFWPDFKPHSLLEAVIDFQRRDRRLGV